MKTHHLLIGSALALAACGGLTHPVDGYSAATAVADRVTLECDGVCGAIRNLDNGQIVDATYQEGLLMNEHVGRVTLDPGRYRVGIMTHPKYTPWDQTAYGSVELAAAPGGVYRVERDFNTGWFGGPERWYVWIEDANGKVVAGEREEP